MFVVVRSFPAGCFTPGWRQWGCDRSQTWPVFHVLLTKKAQNDTQENSDFDRDFPFCWRLVDLPAVWLPPTPPELIPVTVQLNWLHYATFAGLYAADQNGDYASEGLRGEFVPGGPNVDFISPVVTGQAQFGAAGAENLIQARAAGKPVRAIAVILRRSPFALVSLADSGITTPARLHWENDPCHAPDFAQLSCHDVAGGRVAGPVHRNRAAIRCKRVCFG